MLFEVKKRNKIKNNTVTGVFAFFQQTCVQTKNLSSKIYRFLNATASILSVHQKKHHLKLLIMQLRSFLSSRNVYIVSVLIKETFF